MRIINRYLLWNNVLVMGICLLTCAGIYLLVDVFDRLDRMLEYGASGWEIGVYFGAKIPLILSQILPGVVFLSLAIQISGMHKRREITALEAGGVSFFRLALFVFLLGVFWTGTQVVFSQALGVPGQKMSERVWDSLGEKRGQQESRLFDVWVRDQEFVVHLDTVWPEQQNAAGIRLYDLGQGFMDLRRMVRAEFLRVTGGSWQLRDVQVFDPQTFEYSNQDAMTLPIALDLSSMQIASEDIDPEEMSLWELSAHIDRLRDSGTNVEVLRTAWHLKLSYAFSALVLSVVALVLTRRWENPLLIISIGLGVIFLLFSVHTLGGTWGESGALPPWLGAWLGNMLVGSLAITVLGFQIGGRR
ncbi:MAG: LptF/LptG family permease [Desulfovermiculus sp.]|nr:LptF/LptG family permease [Desulfovermiculus sp.]